MTQIHSPKLDAVTFRSERRRTTLEMRVSAPTKPEPFILRLTDPVKLAIPGKTIVTEEDIRSHFNESCDLIQVFEERSTVEFWGNNGFLSGIKGHSLSLT